MAVLIVIGWYATGFLATAHLVRRGHDRTVWTIAAALIGALVVPVAVGLAAWRALRPPRSLVPVGSPGVAVVMDEDPDAALASLARVDPPPSSVLLLALTSHEASATWIDTGELHEARFRFAAHRMRSPLATEELVVAGGPTALAEVGAPLIVMPRDRRDRSRRHDAWRVLAVARSTGAPVLSPATTAHADRHVGTTPATRKATT